MMMMMMSGIVGSFQQTAANCRQFFQMREILLSNWVVLEKYETDTNFKGAVAPPGLPTFPITALLAVGL